MTRFCEYRYIYEARDCVGTRNQRKELRFKMVIIYGDNAVVDLTAVGEINKRIISR